jgi:hypothetical protein
MAKTNLSGIRFAKDREPPNKTQLRLEVGSLPSHARVKLKLPGQRTWKDLGEILIVNEILTLPVRYAFLCHQNDDEQRVAEVGERLNQDAVLTWFAPNDLTGGDTWREKIDEAIERSDYILVFLSKGSLSKTGYSQREVKYAFEQRELRPDGERYIILVLLEDFSPPRRFKDIHWIEYWKPDGYERLLKALA